MKIGDWSSWVIPDDACRRLEFIHTKRTRCVRVEVKRSETIVIYTASFDDGTVLWNTSQGGADEWKILEVPFSQEDATDADF